MNLWSGVAVYFVTWWLCLFMVLPFGARAVIDAADIEKGKDAGAPRRPRLLTKMMATTVLASVVFAAFYAALETGAISLGGP